MKTLKAVGYFIGKWTWNGIIGVILLALALTFALCKVVGGFGAKITALVGLAWFGLDIILLIFRVFPTTKDWIQMFGGAALVGLGPAFAVGIVGEILERLTIAVRDNCFID